MNFIKTSSNSEDIIKFFTCSCILRFTYDQLHLTKIRVLSHHNFYYLFLYFEIFDVVGQKRGGGFSPLSFEPLGLVAAFLIGHDGRRIKLKSENVKI